MAEIFIEAGYEHEVCPDEVVACLRRGHTPDELQLNGRGLRLEALGLLGFFDGADNAVLDGHAILHERFRDLQPESVVLDGVDAPDAQNAQGSGFSSEGGGIEGDRQVEGHIHCRVGEPCSDFVGLLLRAGVPPDVAVGAGQFLHPQPGPLAPWLDGEGPGPEHAPGCQRGGNVHVAGYPPGKSTEGAAEQAVQVKSVRLDLPEECRPAAGRPLCFGEVQDGGLAARLPLVHLHRQRARRTEVAVATHDAEVEVVSEGGHEVGHASDGATGPISGQVPIDGDEHHGAGVRTGHVDQSIVPRRLGSRRGTSLCAR